MKAPKKCQITLAYFSMEFISVKMFYDTDLSESELSTYFFFVTDTPDK